MISANIKFDSHNYRNHSEKNLKLIKKSLKEAGAGRSILFDKDGEIIAGNATYKMAQELGLKVRVIQTDGKELIAVQRIDLSTSNKKRKKLALMDNTTSQNADWDFDTISADFEMEELPNLGLIEVPIMAELSAIERENEPIENEPTEQKFLICPCCGETAPKKDFKVAPNE